MSTLSEGELHVQAMRLVCEALADREKTGLEVDWDVLCHMHDHMDVIFRGIEDQRRDDQDELLHTRKDRDHWKLARQEAIEAGELMKAEIETLRKQLDAANAAATLQRTRIERLQAFVGVVRAILDREYDGREFEDISRALVELDAGTEPTPVAEPLDEENDTCPGK